MATLHNMGRPSGLPYSLLSQAIHRLTRAELEDLAQSLIDHMDAIDPDPDAEDDDPAGQCDEDGANTNIARLVTGREARAYLHFANSYNRLTKLIELDGIIDAQAWLTVLGEEWPSCDNIGEHLPELLSTFGFDLLREDIPRYRSLLMTEQERASLEALPEQLTVWRGCYETNKRGICWSLSEDVAKRFPFTHRYIQDGQALILRAEVKRDEIFMLKLDRNEAEIVAEGLKIKSTRKLLNPNR